MELEILLRMRTDRVPNLKKPGRPIPVESLFCLLLRQRDAQHSHLDLGPSPWLSYDGRSGSSRRRFKVVCCLLDSLIEKRYG